MNEMASFQECGYAHIKGVFHEKLLEQVAAGAVEHGAPALPVAQHVFQPTDSVLLHFEPLFTDTRLLEFAHKALRSKIKVSLLEYVQTPTEGSRYDHETIGHGWNRDTRIGIHRDGAWIDRDVGVVNPPMLSLKVAIWCSDVSIGDGNLRVWPRSHLFAAARDFQAHEHVDIQAQAGDVTWFDRRIFHSRTHNLGNKTRRVVFLEFSVTWIKRKQNFQVNIGTLKMLSPIGHQLLQDAVDPWACYWP
jgi:ectoine hydroxylase-related dioxygenase (phytanoyl-CoA dioxygenase family)